MGDGRENGWVKELKGKGLVDDAFLGLSWDGREELYPDLSSSPTVQHYTSDSNFLPQHIAVPARVVRASTLSSYPPRPPLRTRSSEPPPPPPELSPSAQIVHDFYHPLGGTTVTPSESFDDRTPTGPPAGEERPTSIASVASFRSASPEFGGESEESTTSLESAPPHVPPAPIPSLRSSKAEDGIERFTLVDGVSPEIARQPVGWVKFTEVV